MLDLSLQVIFARLLILGIILMAIEETIGLEALVKAYNTITGQNED